MKKPKIPWRELDKPIAGLVRSLNAVPYIATTSSCQGEEDRSRLFNPEVKAHDQYANVLFRIEQGYELELERLAQAMGAYAIGDFGEGYIVECVKRMYVKDGELPLLHHDFGVHIMLQDRVPQVHRLSVQERRVLFDQGIHRVEEAVKAYLGQREVR